MNRAGISLFILTLLAITAVILKLTGLADLTWTVVLLPIWLPTLLICVMLLLVLCTGLLVKAKSKFL